MNGILYAFLANITFVSSNVIFRKSEKEASPLFINTVRTFVGTITFILIALFAGVFPVIFQLPISLWIWLILSFVFGQIIGDTSYFTAQKDLGATQAMAIALTFPAFTYILSLIFLNEEFK
ncbi:MAG: EamA family transporter, partial [Promethearchaeota archaeon]